MVALAFLELSKASGLTLHQLDQTPNKFLEFEDLERGFVDFLIDEFDARLDLSKRWLSLDFRHGYTIGRQLHELQSIDQPRETHGRWFGFVLG